LAELESDGVETKFRIDCKGDKKPKQIARDMMRMTLAIDKDSFEAMTSSFSLHHHRQCRNPRQIE
jgi:hypothetical protein